MKIYSFIKNGIELKPVEVEVTLMPGLPQFHIMGLPDAAIKESQHRIKAALKSQGYELPTKMQVLVNLRPAHLKKSSRGVELAIACAYLWRTGQLEWPKSCGEPDSVYIYGELSLEGKIYLPGDFESLLNHKAQQPVFTGPPDRTVNYPLWVAESLRHLSSPTFVPPQDSCDSMVRPALSSFRFSKAVAHVMAVTAVGEHSLLLAGPAGSGKSTVTESIYQLLKDPEPSELRKIQQIARLFGRDVNWRPYVNPHHTATSLAMVGGGSPPFPGEITRAHGGCLVLDELLEFSSAVKEALREPIESGEITVSRLGKVQKFPANFHLMATTNLCPCGSYTPGRVVSCRYSLMKCRSYLERLSGPLLDRFEILSFSHNWKESTHSNEQVELEQIFERVQQAQEFAQKTRGQRQVNSRLQIPAIEVTVLPFVLKNLLPETGHSRRRRQAILRVARTLADLDGSEMIKACHIDQASDLALKPFLSLQHSI